MKIHRTKVRTLFALVLALATIQATSTSAASVTAPSVRPVSNPGITISKDVTTVVQTKLASYGYTIKIDGIYGNQTIAVVRAWQRANNLFEDGIAGPRVLASLSLVGGNQTTVAVVAATPKPAVRVTPPEPAPVVVESGDVESIIRDVWSGEPANITDWAVKIATRESNLQPGVRNSCCWGLFQLNWSAHHRWMTTDFGITDPHQLLDPRVNATIALTMYHQGGIHPWDCHGQCTDIFP